MVLRHFTRCCVSTLSTLLFTLCGIHAAQADTSGQPPARRWTVGVQTDVLSYIIGGWHASMFGAYDNVRVRGVISQSFVPEFLRDDLVTEQQISAVACSVDFLFGPRFDGWWLGFGYEQWTTTYSTATSSGEGRSHLLIVGGGFVQRFWKGFFVEPSAAAHISIAGPAEVQVGSATIFTDGVSPEISLKVGWMF